MIQRNISKTTLDILLKYNKIAMVSGPRQSGKTTFSKKILESFEQGIYVNWDIINHQKKILKNPYFFEEEDRDSQKKFLVIFDEIHKYPNWKNYIKGCYDGYKDDFSFICTGSGRLDIFTKGGDSLFGRYLPLPLLPFSLGELISNDISWKIFSKCLKDGFKKNNKNRKIYENLLRFSGFPEPFVKKEKTFYNVWSSERKKTLVREDIRNAYAIREIANIEVLSNLIPDKVGSKLSVNSLREDLNSSFDSVKNWLLILEQFYYFFSIPPYSKSVSRSIKKERKVYLYDWVEVFEKAKRFENILAFHLYKAVKLWNSCGFGNFELFYIRDRDEREVDFLIVKDKRPFVLIEAKLNDVTVSKNLIHFQSVLNAPYGVQVVHKEGVFKKTTKNGFVQFVVSIDNFLSFLP